MSDIILHHFDISPFAEKVRLALGLKNLAWQSVQIPLVMPKPNLTALTGGYRKTPVMQIGADIYCDSQCIAAELERCIPAPSLFPDGSRGLSLALSAWSDVAFFRPGASLSMGTNAELPEDILEDRRQFFTFMDLDDIASQLPHFNSQFRAHLQLVQDSLADGRQFLLAGTPGWADILAYFPLWMCRANIANASLLVESLEDVLAWEKRMMAIGHGERTELSAQEALQIAANSQPDTTANILADALPRLQAGQPVHVTPDDYGKVTVSGELCTLTHSEIRILRKHPDLGDIMVHFPRLGYIVEPQV